MPDASSDNQSLPPEIVESIAIANAKSIGEQPAILANLALANQIMNTNLQQQMAIAALQAMNQVMMATMAKCVSLILSSDASPEQVDATVKLLESMRALAPSAVASAAQPPSPPEGAPAAKSPAQPHTASRAAGESSIPGEVVEALAIANVNSLGTQPAALANLALSNLVQNMNQAQQNAISHQQAMNAIQAAVVARVVDLLTTLEAPGGEGKKPSDGGRRPNPGAAAP